jgi:hypothetical protein
MTSAGFIQSVTSGEILYFDVPRPDPLPPDILHRKDNVEGRSAAFEALDGDIEANLEASG